MLDPRGHKINLSGLNTGMPQYIGQLYNILAGCVENSGEQMPQIVGEHFCWRYICVFTQTLQFRPDLAAGQFFSAFGAKDCAGSGFLFFCILEQLAAQFG